MLIICCSPHQGGITDMLGKTIAQGAIKAESSFHLVSLRDFSILPCCGCNYCWQNNGQCILPDKSPDHIFELILNATSLIIISPIFFYSLPAHFKALIDRSQPFWRNDWVKPVKKIPVLPILTAGRSTGQKLFDGSLLTLKWFLKPFNAVISHALCYRGLDSRTLPVNLLTEVAEYGALWQARKDDSGQ